MKKIFSMVLIIMIISQPAFSQGYVTATKNDDGFTNVYKSIPIGSGYTAGSESRYGLINSSGKFILPMIYKSVFNAGEPGVYEVKDTLDNVALFNAYNQGFITDFVYFDIERFSDGLAVVKKRNQSYGFDWGAVDTKGNLVIPAEYKYLGSLREGLINFKKEGKMGYMDRNQQVVIPETYFNYADFSYGLAAASPAEGGKLGYIDKKNNMVIPAQYEEASTFYKGYAIVARKKSRTVGGARKPSVTYPGEMLLIDRSGKELTTSPYDRITNYQEGGVFIVSLNNKDGVIDSTGKLILPVEYKEARSDYNGNIIVRTQDDKYGLINNKGDFIMKPEYEFISSYTNDKMYFKQKGRSAVMDKKRKLIIPADSAVSVIRGKRRILFIYDNKVKVFDNSGKLEKTFSEGNIKTYSTGFTADEDSLKIEYNIGVELITVATGVKKQLHATEAGDFNEEGILLTKNKDNKYYFYDYTGKQLNSTGYYSAINFSEGVCAVQETGNSIPYLADKNFKKIKDLTLAFQGPFSEGLALCTNSITGDIIYINKKGEEVFRVNAKEGEKCINGRIVIKDPYNRYCFYDNTGKKIGNRYWDELAGFSEGLAAAKSGSKWCFIDSTGEPAIALLYDAVGNFTKGTSVVKIDGKFKLINKKGEAIDNNLYDGASNPDNGTFPLMKGGKVGLVDYKGNTIIGFNYKNIKPMNEDRAWAMKDDNWGLLDSKGNALTGFIYKEVGDFENGFAKGKVNDKIALINKSGQVVVPASYSGLGSVYKGTVIGIKSAGIAMYGLK